MTALFSWNDSVDYYETPDWTPKVDPLREQPGATVKLLNGHRMVTRQVDENGVPVTRTGVRLSWAWVDPDLLEIASATYLAGRTVTVTYPWRGATATITGVIPPDADAFRETPIEGDRSALEILLIVL